MHQQNETHSSSAASANSASTSLIESVNQSAGGAIFTDGTYTGTADGYGPSLTVSVTIKDNLITGIQIVSHHEKNQRFYAKPMREVPAEIIEKQSLDVDMVAGAT